jgi:hypothetical protein
MFGKRGGRAKNQLLGPVGSSDQTMPKYPRPKILLIDMKDETESVLKAEGYDVVAGSFGVPYRVPKEDKLFPVIINGSLPSNFTE